MRIDSLKNTPDRAGRYWLTFEDGSKHTECVICGFILQAESMDNLGWYDENMFWYTQIVCNKEFTISASATNGGMISDVGDSIVKYGTTKNYIIKPFDGYRIKSVYINGKNIGVAATANKLLAAAKGVFFHFLMSDDMVLTDNYNSLIDKLYDLDADILAMDLLVNNGDIWQLTAKMDEAWCAQACRFIRRSIVDGIKYPEKVKAGEDRFFHREMMQRNPRVVYSGVTAYRYNFPREGSLMNLRAKGLIADEYLRP